MAGTGGLGAAPGVLEHARTAPVGARGFLFSDLRGYTAFVEGHGDASAAQLIGVYRTLVREVVGRHDGAEIKTEGDGFYVVFPTASSAVEAGVEIIRAAAEASTDERPIRVGVGIHCGETVETGEGLVGGAVNIAARVGANARSGEILVTDTVRELTRTYLPYRYTALGRQKLKGVKGGVALYRVETAPTGRLVRLQRQLSARRGRVAVGVALAAALVAASAGIYAVNRPPDCITLPKGTKDVLARVDPDRLCVIATLAVGRNPASLEAVEGALWVVADGDSTIQRVDLPGTVATTAGLPQGHFGMTTGPDGTAYLLVGEGARSIVAFDRSTGQQKQSLVLPEAGGVVGVGGGYHWFGYDRDSIWVAAVDGTIARVVVQAGQVDRFSSEPVWKVTTFPTLPSVKGAIFGEGMASTSAGIWMVNQVGDRPREKRELVRIGDSGVASTADIDPHGWVMSIAAARDSLWMPRSDGWLTRFDPATGVAHSVDLTIYGAVLAADGDALWVADHDGNLARFDIATGTAQTLKVGGRPGDVAVAADGSVWVSLGGSG